MIRRRTLVGLGAGIACVAAVALALADDGGGSSAPTPSRWVQSETLLPEAMVDGGAPPGGGSAVPVTGSGAAAPLPVTANGMSPVVGPAPGPWRMNGSMSPPPQPPSGPAASPPVSQVPTIDVPPSSPAG